MIREVIMSVIDSIIVYCYYNTNNVSHCASVYTVSIILVLCVLLVLNYRDCLISTTGGCHCT